MTRRPRLTALPTLLTLAIVLPALLVLGTLFVLYIHPAYAQAGSAPEKPTGLTGTSAHDAITLTWDHSNDDSITGYVILRRNRDTDAEGEFTELVSDTGSAATGYTDGTVAAETRYTYRIKAINEHGESGRSRWYHIDTPAVPVPDQPTGLTGTAAHDAITLSWDHPNDDSITGYVILRRIPGVHPEGQFRELVSDTGSAATTYTDGSVAAETRYTYRIKAINEHGASERSRWYHIDTPAMPVPDQPTGLTAQVSPDQVVLTWDDPDDGTITGYMILRRDEAVHEEGIFDTVASDTGTAATTYTDDTVKRGKKYVYRIRALNERGESDVSGWVRADTVPAKPRTLIAQEVAHDTVTLGWRDPQDDSIAGYVILRRDKAVHEEGIFDTVAPDTGSGATTYTDDTVEPNKQYVYRIRAINAAGLSEISSWVRAYTPAVPVPDRPTGLTAAASHDRVVLTWNDPQDETITHYQALRRDWWDPGSSFVVIAEDTGGADATYLDATVASQRGYAYRVRAVNRHGASEASEAVSVNTLAPPIVVGSTAEGQTLWSATLTAGPATRDGEPLVGYSVWNDGIGALSDTSFDAGGRTVTVQVLMVAGSGGERGLYLGLTERLEGDAALRVGTEEFNLAEAELIRGGNWIYRWSGAGLEWTEDEEVAVSIVSPEPDGSSLRGLSLEGMSELPFSAERTRYEARRRVGQQKTTVNVQVRGGTASVLTVRSNGPLAFDAGDADAGQAGHQAQLSARGQTLVIVQASSEDGSRGRAYVVRVSEAAGSAAGRRSATRSAADADATLSALALEGIDLEPAFASGTHEYRAAVGSNVDTVTVTAAATQSGADTLITPVDADPDTGGHQIRLPGGSPATAPIIVVVRSADGSALESYVVTVTRAAPPNNDASLSALSLSGVELIPAFASGVFAYTAAVGPDVEQTTVTAAANDANARVSITPVDADDMADGHQVELIEGANTITVAVTAADEQATHEYIVTVTRAEGLDDASLAELSLEGLELSPAFDADTQSYTARTGAASARVTLVARPNDAAAGVVISPADADADAAGWQIYLAAAEPWDDPVQTNIAIVVTSSDGAARKSYLVQVSRMPRSRAPADSEGFVRVDAGWDDICAVRVDGTLECWRPSGFSAGSHRARLKVGTPEGIFTDVIVANLFACGIRDDDTGFCWGDDLNDRTFENADVTSVSAHTFYGICMGRADGNATCYRYSWSEEQRMDSPQDTNVAGSLESVVAGRMFGCGLDGDGLARCWKPGGWLDAPDGALKFIAAGGTQVCGIKEADSSLMCWEWAYGSSWRITGPRNEYTHLTDEPEGEFVHVDTSYGPSCAVKSEGGIVCWGSASMISTARMLEELNDVPEGEYLTVSVDWDWFACGLRTDKTIACWGYDNEALAESIPPFESPWKDSADLLGLDLTAGELSPDFDRDTTEYTATVANEVASVEVMPQLTNTLATYLIASDNDTEVLNGAVDLVVGANTITVVVTSADATVMKTYTILVTRAPDSP